MLSTGPTLSSFGTVNMGSCSCKIKVGSSLKKNTLYLILVGGQLQPKSAAKALPAKEANALQEEVKHNKEVANLTKKRAKMAQTMAYSENYKSVKKVAKCQDSCEKVVRST